MHLIQLSIIMLNLITTSTLLVTAIKVARSNLFSMLSPRTCKCIHTVLKAMLS